MTDTHTTAHIPDEAMQADLDARLKAAGMYTVEEIMGGTPVDKWRVHSGMDNLQFFGEWLERKTREYKIMAACYDIGDNDKSDELYEWVLAHSGAFHDVLVNFRAAIRALSPAEPAHGEQWQDMKSAPLSGRSVVVFDSFLGSKDGKGQVVARFDKEHGWHVAASVVGGIYIKLTNPSKWMPLPAAPTTEAGPAALAQGGGE